MMVQVKCPSCGTEGSISLFDPKYEGPYKCWKCRAAALIRLENNQLTLCEAMSEDEFEKQQEMKELRDKFNKGEDEED